MKTIGVYLLGTLFGALVTWMIMSEREYIPPAPSPTPQTSKAPEPEEESDPFPEDSPPSNFEDPWMDRLEKQSGRWASIDGQFEFSLDWRQFTLGKMPDWANVEQQTFLLDQSLQFLSGNGKYWIYFNGEKNDSMRLIRNDGTTDDYNDITLYREDHPKANSRKPLPKAPIPKEIQVMLDKIPLILKTDTANQALSRIGLKNYRDLEYLSGESRWGETRGVINLGINDEWMIKFCNSQKSRVVEIQLFRGSVSEYRKTGETLEEIAYPHLYGDYIIKSPSKVRKFR